MTSEVSPKVKLRWESIQFLCLSLFVPQVRGSLDYARDDGTFFVVISTSPNHAVISTKRSAWRNPLRRSSTYPPLSFYPHKLLGLCFLIYSFNFLHCTTFSYTHLSLFHPSTKQFSNPTLCFLLHLPTLSSHCFYSLSFYLSLL